jgi:hypothetical protein
MLVNAKRGGTFMRYFQITTFAMLLLCAPMRADDVSDRAGLLGRWQQQDDSAKEATVWVLELKGTALHITRSLGDQKISEFECQPNGTECDGTAERQKASATIFYDGPALVEFETRGSDVTRRRFTIAGQIGVMEIEVTLITGGDKTETLRLKRVKLASKSR